MSSSFYSRLDLHLKTLLEDLATVAGLHIGSIEYTVMREKGQFQGLLVEILFLPLRDPEQPTLGKSVKE